MTTWLTGLGLGVSVAAPIGPVNVATIQLGLARGFRPAAAFGLGAATIDALYCFAVYLGIAPLLVAAPWLKVVLYAAGAILLARMGWSALRKRIELSSGTGRESGGVWRSYTAGIALTAINPATILSWLAIGGAALSGVPASEGWLLVVGIFTGSTIWFGALAVGVSVGRRAVDERALRIVSIVCALALFGFAAFFAWNGVGEVAQLIGR